MRKILLLSAFVVITLGVWFFYNKYQVKMLASDNLIPRETLFGNPDKIAVQISPDGQYITYIAPLEGVLNIYLAKASAPAEAKAITSDKARGIRNYHWSYDNKSILYSQDSDGDENDVVYRINIQDNTIVPLTSSGSKAFVQSISHKFPNQVLVSTNERRKDLFDVYKVDLSTNKRELVYKNDQYAHLVYDDNSTLRFAQKYNLDSSVDVYMILDAQDIQYKHILPSDVELYKIAGFTKNNDAIYYIDSSNRNTAALYRDYLNGLVDLVASNDKSDICDFTLSPLEKTLQHYTYEYEKSKNVFIDKAIESDFKFLQDFKGQDFEVNIVSRSLQDDVWIVAFTSSFKPINYYIYHRDGRKLDFLFVHNERLKDLDLVKMHPVIIKSRDGLDLVSYLSLPQGVELQNPAKHIPLVVLVHGGPIMRDSYEYSAIHQWLANRGYGALSVNYRGSTGLGKSFVNLADGQWGAKMQEDLIDAANWAISQGIADKKKIAIMGGSYGGYAALAGVAFTPEYFACGVDIVGPSNLVTLLKSVPDYWKPAIGILIKRLGGDADTKEGLEFLESRSPLNFANKITKPLLIAQGKHDPRVKQTESDQIVKKMQEHKIPVTYLLYPNEGHGFARPENRMSFYAVAEQFLAKYLGGNFQAIGNAFDNTSLEIMDKGDLKDLEIKK